MSAIQARSLSTATSLFSKPFTKAEALAALREPVPEKLLSRILPLISDLRFTLSCMKERQASLCQTLLFSHELSQKQFDQAIVLLDAVADLIEANAKSVAMADLIDANAKEE